MTADSADEFAVFAGEHQHLAREDQEVTFVGAGVQGEVRAGAALKTVKSLSMTLVMGIGPRDSPWGVSFTSPRCLVCRRKTVLRDYLRTHVVTEAGRASPREGFPPPPDLAD